MVPELSASSGEPSRSSTVEPATPSEIIDLSNDKRFERLKFLVKQSKIYASVLSSRLAIEQKQEEQEQEEKRHKPKRQKTGKKSSRGNKVFDKLDEKQVEDLTADASGKSVKEALSQSQEQESAAPILETQKSGFKQSKLVSGVQMHAYQLAGVEWLISLYENGLNGILADEMGLGKTVQTIGFLAHLIENGITGPFLIVAPLSTIQNWLNEFERFAPKIKAVKYHGSAPERQDLQKSRGFLKNNVIITSFEIVVRDVNFFRKHSWMYVVVDEGHRLKNMNCKLIKELKSLDSANRLLLTGTPLQNNLAELWSLLNFLLPDIFADLELFQSWFDEMQGNADFGKDNANLISSLHEILRPFLLRRLKSDVEQFLPDKREYVIYTKLTEQQTELYESILNKTVADYVANKIRQSRNMAPTLPSDKGSAGGNGLAVGTKRSRNKSRSNYREIGDREFFKNVANGVDMEETKDLFEERLLKQTAENLMKQQQSVGSITNGKSFRNMVMQLRLACNTPYLFYYPWTDQDELDSRIVEHSSKMMALDKLCKELTNRGHRILIFSQFYKMLDVLQDWFVEYKGWPVCRIDGSTAQTDRQEQIDYFNSKKSDCKVFLLSTRAGGLGINLTAADTVVLFDSDWNPQMDLQAIDRVHRIGQTKPVVVYRLATAGTVETEMLKKAAGKRQLEKLIIENGRFKGFGAMNTVGSREEEGGGGGGEGDDAMSMLHKEIVHHGQDITDSDLEIVLDRSPEAYAKAREYSECGGVVRLSSHISCIVGAPLTQQSQGD